ncbi:MAG: DUF4199 domain-containing protein [Sphingobacteriaceae bacterium]
MKNAIKYGLMIGVLSALWIMLMHLLGVYNNNTGGPRDITWMEYLSVFIPFSGLYWGLKEYRKTHFKHKMSFFQGLMQGFKILLVGGVLYMATLSIYLKYIDSTPLKIDYLQRLSAVGTVGILLDLVVSLMLMTRPRNL